jgi:iron complex transport system substrate-binding protein
VLRSLVLVVAAAVAALLLVPVAVAKVPQRIISLSPSATETLFAIGAARQVVAVDSQSDYPRTVPRTQLSSLKPNIEAIAAYRPDLVVYAYDPGGLADSLAKLKIRALKQDAPPDLNQAYAQIEALGRATGHTPRARRLVATMQRQIAKLVAPARKLGTGRTVYHELDPTLYTVTSKTFIGKVYSLFGLRNVGDAADASGSGYPQLSAEYVVAQNPDVIVLADTVCCGQSLKTVAARPGWDRIAAVRSGLVLRIDDSIASRWGPRTVNFVRAVSSALSHFSRR